MVAEESTRELEPGDSAPTFSLPGTDNTQYNLDSFSEKALLIVFTCNHCPYAEAKHPALNAIAAEYENCAVVGINPNDATEYPEDSFDRMRELVANGTISYDAYLRDESQGSARAYGATCTPDPYLFRRESGTYRLVYHGRLDDALNPDAEPSGEPGFEMRELIDQVLADKPIETEFKPSRGCSIKWSDSQT